MRHTRLRSISDGEKDNLYLLLDDSDSGYREDNPSQRLEKELITRTSKKSQILYMMNLPMRLHDCKRSPFILDTSLMIQMNRVKSLRCALCGKGINFRYKAMLQWNISGELCGECYGKKLTEHYISAERQTTIKNN